MRAFIGKIRLPLNQMPLGPKRRIGPRPKERGREAYFTRLPPLGHIGELARGVHPLGKNLSPLTPSPIRGGGLGEGWPEGSGIISSLRTRLAGHCTLHALHI